MAYLEKFYEIASIPHGSKNTKLISDYLYKFAKRCGVYVRQDELNNIIMIKEATPGYEDHPPVLLQGHMDMVAVKEEDCFIDMAVDGLDLYVEDGCLKARGTSLGGDDGIAVAYIMELMENNYPAPKIEAVITVDEEIGMLGATDIDLFDITAKQMINLDQEEEGIFVTGCAGGAVCDIHIPVTKEIASGNVYTIRVSGLKGGHSGVDIDKNRGNGIKIIADELCKLAAKVPFKIIEINGGVADNAIPNDVCAKILLEDENLNSIFEREILMLNGLELFFGDAVNYDRAEFSVFKEKYDEMIVLDEESSRKLPEIIKALPYGILSMSKELEGVVETSANPGIITSYEEHIGICISVRSCVNEKKERVILDIGEIVTSNDATMDVHGIYPGWDYVPGTDLEKLMVETYEGMFKKKPTLIAIHAGLECGIFSDKIKGLSCISIGPDIMDIHSVNERLPLDSADRCFEYLKEVLRKL